MGRTCRGICKNFKAEVIPMKLRYKLGHKRCTFCAIFIDPQYSRCPCCKGMLRVKPRSKERSYWTEEDVKNLSYD